PRSEQLERGCHGVRILWCQVLVVQEHFDSGGHLGGAEPAEAAWRTSSRVLGARRPASLLEAAEARPVDRGSRTAGWPCDAPAGRVVAPASLVQQRESGSRGTRADQGGPPHNHIKPELRLAILRNDASGYTVTRSTTNRYFP